ncbi:MAG: alpha-amylase family glycosyl hydrolase, partial [Egibacteraceae bacterium]
SDYASFAGLPELPQLDLDHPPVRDHVFEEVLPFYLDDLGVDGFRLDHVQGPSRDFWRAFDAELDRRWPETLVIGEVWAPLTTINSYGDVLDAATAFPLRDRLLATFAGEGDVRAVSMPIAATLDEQGLPDATQPRQQSYLSSHDQPRFAHEADDDARRVALAYAAILTLPGLPTIYYGDEVGSSQTDALPPEADFADRWFREPMPWDRDIWSTWDDDLLARVATFARARTTTPALHSGRYLEVVGAGDVWVFERVHGDDRLLVALNNGEVAADLRDVLADAAWPDLAVLEDAEEVVAPSLSDVDTGSSDDAALRVPALDALVLRLPTG